MWQLRTENREKVKKHHAEFKQIFGVQLTDYMDTAGFDVVKFDEEFLKTPDGISTKELIYSKYGQRAVSLAEALLA